MFLKEQLTNNFFLNKVSNQNCQKNINLYFLVWQQKSVELILLTTTYKLKTDANCFDYQMYFIFITRML